MKKSIIIIGIIIILTLIGGVVWYWQKYQGASIKGQGNDGQSSDVGNQQSEIINTKDWQTYRNEEYGFNFKYPQEWQVENLNKRSIGVFPFGKIQGIEYNGDVVFFIRDRINGQDIEDVYNGSIGPELFKSATGGYSQINIQGNKAIYFKNVMGLMPSDIVIVALKNKFIEISANNHYDIFRAILNSLKF